MTAPFLISLITSVLIVQVFVKLFGRAHISSVVDYCTFWMSPFHNTACQYFRLFDAIFTNRTKNGPEHVRL